MDYEVNRFPYIDLESAIERIDFSGDEVPPYMQNISVPKDPVLDMRLSVSMLDQFYLESGIMLSKSTSMGRPSFT